MSQFDNMANEFLSQERIAIAGVSRSEDGTANAIYRTLRDKGYSMFAVNPSADEVEGDETEATPQKKSTFGAFGALVGLESPQPSQPLDQGVEAVRTSTEKTDPKLV